jgi:DNA-binding CsgD family transcriptional regulator
MGTHKEDIVGVVEAAYAIELPLRDWLKGVIKASRPSLDDTQGMFGGLYDASDPERFQLTDLVGSGIPEQTVELIRFAAEGARPDIISRARWEVCSTLSQAVGAPALDSIPLMVAAREAFGVHDILGLNAGDPTLKGCILAAPLMTVRTLAESFQRTWSRIASHIAAGFRLRRQLEKLEQQGFDGAEAVLDPGGKIEHVEGVAEDKAARAALRGAAVAIDKARKKKMRESRPEEAISQWETLVRGRWSLVDHFDKDGRRYLVARKNDPFVPGDKLSLRERQVVGFAALGHSNKLIAYELGISTSSVATHLTNAAKKLGLGTRVALIKAFSERQL